MPAEEPSGPASPVVLRLTLERGEPIRGAAERADGTGAHSFRGWVDLMSAIEALRGPGSKDRA